MILESKIRSQYHIEVKGQGEICIMVSIVILRKPICDIVFCTMSF